MEVVRLTTIAARRSTGPALPAGRGAGVGRAGSTSLAARVQYMLPVYRKLDGSGRPEPGGLPKDLPLAGQLSRAFGRICNLAHQRDAQFAGGSLPAHAARPHDRFDRRRNAAARGETFERAHAGQDRCGSAAQCPSAARVGATFAGIARSGNLARFARFGIQRDSRGSFGAGRHGKIENQSRTNRARANSFADGREARMKRS